MRDSTLEEIKQAIIAAINEDPDGELREYVMSIPGEVEKTVQELTPIVTGRTEESIEVKSRRTEYKRLSTRKINIGEVYSDDDPERIGAIEYGRKPGAKYGESEGAFMFHKAAALWNGEDPSGDAG